ncbi:coiled-coil domain-containing protein 115 [Plodia interpunctella]|uniref:coiled-coil domain-containing protein 115 n=1 Tax=Plodia interpunctella TaxID=58824 RepID=UPI002367F911|nr:coiled-coil domain-containing protein 115 [Plodia interpunctella]
MALEKKDDFDVPTMEDVCELLDKLTLKQLHLMEEKMRGEMNIESSIQNGSINLAKSRYIMGQSSVSTARLPVENSPEFAASTKCETTEEDGVKQLRVIENEKNTVNPLHWFGVLVPQNLHKAQSIFQNTINFVVECVNVQLQLYENLKTLDVLKKYKGLLDSS